MMNRIYVVITCLLVVHLAGCKEKNKRTLLFSHHLHVVENEMECADCHGDLKDGGWKHAGHDACAACHDDVVQTRKISEETCGFCHKQKNLNEITKQRVDRKTSGTFVHTEALKGMCRECHGNILDKKLKHVPDLSQRTLIETMRKACVAGKECAMCHVNMSPDTTPGSHHSDWTRLHGSRSGLDDAICSVCHTDEETCRECHKSTRPQSHNTLWRTRAHGVKANWDRAKCQTCHEEDFCVACHAETKPRSHKASWNSTHCYSCHTSESDGTGCAMCHKTSFDNHPDPHEAGWKKRHCSRCHDGGGGVQQCELCHKDVSDSHGNPHKGNWLKQHCTSCHDSGAQQCGQCHKNVSDSHGNPHKGNWLDQHCVSCHQDGSDNCGECHPGGNSVFVHEGTWTPIHDIFGTTWDCLICHTP